MELTPTRTTTGRLGICTFVHTSTNGVKDIILCLNVYIYACVHALNTCVCACACVCVRERYVLIGNSTSWIINIQGAKYKIQIT